MTILDHASRRDGRELGDAGHAVLWMVDNNPADLEIVGIVCEMIGFRGRFVPFSDGAQAIAHLATIWERSDERPDVILLDINMPRLSGMAVLRAIRGDARWAELPLVMFSTSSNEERVARESGATGYVVKPALIPDTAAAIRGVIARWCKAGSLAPE